MTSTQHLAKRLLRAMQTMNHVAKLKPDSIISTLNVNQVRMLIEIKNRPGIAQKDIAEILGISPASVSVAIRQMEDVDLVQRKPDEDDGRIMCLFLGGYGKEIVAESEGQQISILSNMLSTLSIDEQQLLVDLLDKAMNSLEKQQK